MIFYWLTKDGVWHKKKFNRGDEYKEERMEFIGYLEESPDVIYWY